VTTVRSSSDVKINKFDQNRNGSRLSLLGIRDRAFIKSANESVGGLEGRSSVHLEIGLIIDTIATDPRSYGLNLSVSLIFCFSVCAFHTSFQSASNKNPEIDSKIDVKYYHNWP